MPDKIPPVIVNFLPLAIGGFFFNRLIPLTKKLIPIPRRGRIIQRVKIYKIIAPAVGSTVCSYLSLQLVSNKDRIDKNRSFFFTVLVLSLIRQTRKDFLLKIITLFSY